MRHSHYSTKTPLTEERCTKPNVKVALITTLDTNVGDDFVREGILAALDRCTPYDAWFVDKHRAHHTCTTRLPQDSEERFRDKIIDADFIIQCGAPVYWNLGEMPGQKCSNAEWVRPLWYERVAAVSADKVVLNLAAGACQRYRGTAEQITKDTQCSAFIRDLSAWCRKTTVRDTLAAEVLSALACEHTVMPCSSIHAWRRARREPPIKGRVAVNYMEIGGHYQLEDIDSARHWPGTFRAIVAGLRSAGQSPVYVAHNEKERRASATIAQDMPVFYSTCHSDYVSFYSSCEAGVVNRVHGAMSLAGLGRPVVLIGNDSRVRTASYIGIPTHPCSSVRAEEVLDALHSMMATQHWGQAAIELEHSAFEHLTAMLSLFF